VCCFGEKSRAIFNFSFHGWCYNSLLIYKFLIYTPPFSEKEFAKLCSFLGTCHHNSSSVYWLQF
jgi:hypothetical protein